MAKASILPDFRAFLRNRNLVQEKYIPYFAHWVSRFLYFCNNNTQSDRTRLILEFMDLLKKDKNISDWQLRQAQHLSHLAIKKRVSASTQNQAFNALRYFPKMKSYPSNLY